ncbi:hypothetical protein AAF712_016891, partial [Marasmius tenuissimus]
MIANAVVDILRHEGVEPIKKYEDDIITGRYPIRRKLTDGSFINIDLLQHPHSSTLINSPSPITIIPFDPDNPDESIFEYEYDDKDMLERIADLRVPWHLKKGDP